MLKMKTILMSVLFRSCKKNKKWVRDTSHIGHLLLFLALLLLQFCTFSSNKIVKVGLEAKARAMNLASTHLNNGKERNLVALYTDKTSLSKLIISEIQTNLEWRQLNNKIPPIAVKAETDQQNNKTGEWVSKVTFFIKTIQISKFRVSDETKT